MTELASRSQTIIDLEEGGTGICNRYDKNIFSDGGVPAI